jgi:peroxiredoxin Q/BCP
MVLQVGDRAPDLQLEDAEGKTWQLSKLKGQRVVLYFYPRDNTPGCTKQACGFRDEYAKFTEQEILVFGISKDDGKSHQKFINKYQLPFTLLSDPEAKVATAYDSFGLKKFMGKEFMGIIRNTFVISPTGTIEKIYRKLKPELHASQILSDLS